MRKPLEHTVTLDMARTDDQAVVSIPKLDTGRRIIFRLRNGAEAYTLTGAMMAAVSLDRGRYGPRINLPLPKAPDDLQEIAAEIGTRVYGEETEQVVIFEWSKDWSMIAGTFRACLHIVDGSMTDLFSPTFIFEVSDSPYDEFSVRTSPGFTALSEAAKDLRETRDELNEFMENALTAKQLYQSLTGTEPPEGVTLEGALAPLVTEDELTEAVRGLENNLAVDGAVYNALRAFVLQKTLEEMMVRYQELLTPELFGALLERGGYYMSYDAVNRRLRATVGGVSMAALMLSGCLTTGGKTRLANYLDHGVFVATDAEAAQIETDINHLVAELTEAVEHTVNVSLPSLTSYVISTVSGVSGAAANVAVVVPPAGTTKTVTITPVNGREITGVNVVGCDYTVTANADGSRTVVLQLTANTESVVVTAATSVIRTIRNLFVSVNLPLYGGMSDVYGLYTGDYSSDQTYGDLRKYLTVTADYDTADGTEDGVVITSYSFDGHSDGYDLPDGNQITVSITVEGITARFKLMPFEQDNIVSVTPSQSLLNIKAAAGTALSALDDKYVLNVKFEHNSGTVPVKLNTLTDEGAIRWGSNYGNIVFGTNTRSIIYDGASGSTAPIQLQITGCMKVTCAGIGAVYRAGRFDEAETVTGGYYLAEPSYGFEVEIEAAERYALTGADGLSASIGSTNLTSKFAFADNKYRAELDVDEWWSLANEMEVPVMTIVINPTATEVNMATLIGGALMIDGLFGNEVSGALVVDIS